MKTYIDILGLKTSQNTKEVKPVDIAKFSSTNSFINAQTNKTYTENGALTNISAGDAIVDWFFHSGALRREKDKNRIISLFLAAFNQDKTKALRLLFYLRDIRGGQGERDVFRTVLFYLANHETEWVKNNLHLIAEYGRWDDYLCLLKTACYDDVVDFIGKQLEEDLKNHLDGKLYNISLLAKWLPSLNSPSKKYKEEGRLLLRSGKFSTAANYRKALSILRKDLNIVERKIAAKEYEDIEYEKLPSRAILKYRKAFVRNDEARYTDYLEKVKNNAAKINTGTLYPYDLVKDYLQDIEYHSYRDKNIKSYLNETVELQWKNLPDYVPEINGLCICDTSGSMSGFPMQVSMSIALYIAERNKSEVWKNYVIPFSSRARFMEVKGDTLLDKLVSIYTGDCSNTNLQSVFDLILDRSVKCNVKKEDMPKQLLIISDMEFDSCGTSLTNFEVITDKYRKAGYDLPQIIWWNVESRNTQTPFTVNDKNVFCLSGCSPVVLKLALNGSSTIYEMIDKITESERYNSINY